MGTFSFAVIALLVMNLALICWVLLLVRSHQGPGSLAASLAGRFDGIDRNGEALRFAVTEMDRALRAEIAQGAREGLIAAFDKVQEGTTAQIEQLNSFGTKLTELRQVIAEKLSEAETRAADGRAALVRDTADAITQARQAIDNSLRTFGDQQRERLLAAEQAVREAKEATEKSSATTAKTLSDQRETITSQLTQSAAAISERLGKELGELAERVRGGFDGFSGRLREEQEQLRQKVESKLDEIRSGNESKLEQMRQAVDEQLKSSLQKGLEDSFRTVIEQFANVQQAIGQVQDVAGQIGDLKRLFSNVKMRGGIGEDHLRAVLDDFLPPGSYERNFRVSDDANEAVEFAIRIPRIDVWLPIDAKFPKEDYDRLVNASESGDREQETAARKSLERRIREEAKRISSKYIKPPKTTEFAIMYLPSEGLDSEVSHMPGLIEALRRQYKVDVMGPRVLPAYLHIIRVGYETLTLEKKAGAIGEILSAVKAEWAKLGQSLDVLSRSADRLTSGIKNTQQRTRVVGRTLKAVSTLEFEQARDVLGLSDEALLIEAEADADDEMPVVVPILAKTPDDRRTADSTEVPF